jgi:hypothetical protein
MTGIDFKVQKKLRLTCSSLSAGICALLLPCHASHSCLHKFTCACSTFCQWHPGSTTVTSSYLFSNSLGIPRLHVVIDMGNTQLFPALPRPGPVEYPYPLWGYRYSHGLAKLNPRVNPYPYPWQVTCGYALTIEQINKI